MSLEKFTIRSLFVLSGMLFLALLTQGTSYVNFFLIDFNTEQSSINQSVIEINSCEKVYLTKKKFLSSNSPSLKTSLNKVLSIKTPKTAGLYSPFYKSNLKVEVIEESRILKVTLNLIGDLNLLSECQAPFVHSLIVNSIQEFYPDYKYEIQLNGSKDNYLELIQPLEFHNQI